MLIEDVAASNVKKRITIGTLPAVAPADHASTHQDGGADEISVAGLSGLLVDSQTPLAHEASHKSGGTDEIRLDEFGSTLDNTDLNASITAHELLRKLDGSSSVKYLRGDGTWNTPVYNFGYASVVHSADPGATSTASATFVNLTANTGWTSYAGRWIFVLSTAGLAGENANGGQYRIVVDDTINIGGSTDHWSAHTGASPSQKAYITMIGVQDFATGGNRTMRVQWRSLNSSYTWETDADSYVQVFGFMLPRAET